VLAWVVGISLFVVLLLAVAIAHAGFARAAWREIKTSLEFKVFLWLLLAIAVGVATLAFVTRR
jgi:hypothetical protein